MRGLGGFRRGPLTLISLSVLLTPAGAWAGLYEANLLSNPSFEDYYTGANPNWSSGSSVQYDLQTNNGLSRGMQGWLNAGSDVAAIRSDGTGTGHTGDYYGSGGDSATAGLVARMRQDIDLLACGFTAAELDNHSLFMDAGAWIGSAPLDSDTIEVRIEYLNAAGASLGAVFSTGPRNDDTWTLCASGPIPLWTGTRSIRFDAVFVKQAGATSDGRIDDAWVHLAPVADPTTPMLDRNLVCNPGFETGARGWQVLAGNPRARLGALDGVPAHSGQALLFGGQRPLAGASNRAVAVQDFTLARYGFSPEVLAQTDGLLFLQFSAWLYSYGDVGQLTLRLEVCDQVGTVLAAYDTGRVRSDKLPSPFRWQIALPPTARTLRLTYDTVDSGGTNLDGYLDDVALIITRAPHRPAQTGPYVAGHRGNSIIAPENTLASFRATAGVARFGELDAYPCATGELVVMHDSTVDRTTEGTGAISSFTLAGLKALDAGAWFSADFAGEPVPTLEEAILTMLPGVTPLIERKGGTAAAYLALLQRLSVKNQVVIQSFDWTFLSQLHQLDPTISSGALLSAALTDAHVLQARQAGAAFIALDQAYVTAASIALAHSQGLQMFVWTVDAPAAVENFIGLGVDGIITDHPAMVSWLVNADRPAADLDGDGDVDAIDLDFFVHCRSGPNLAWARPECQAADLEGDGDVDQGDFGLLQIWLNNR